MFFFAPVNLGQRKVGLVGHGVEVGEVIAFKSVVLV